MLFTSQTGLSDLREELAMKGMLRAVITMPSGLLQHTGAGFALMVIDTCGGNEQTLLIDADSPRYNTRDGRSRSRFDGWQWLHADFKAALAGESIESGRLVSQEEIAAQNCQLQANRYLRSNALRQVQNYFVSIPSRPLGDLVQVLRPSLLDREKGADAVEVSLSDFPIVGYTRNASKPVQITIRRNLDELYLRPNDILIVTKGAMSIFGKVALIGPEAEGKKWVANQMCLILRVESDQIDSRYLYRYLQSDLAKIQVQNLNLGGMIANLRPNDLKSIVVPLPSLENQEETIETFQQIVDVQNQLIELTHRRDMLSISQWPEISGDDSNTNEQS